MLSPDSVDGTFTDDVDGLPAEHPNAQARIGMSDSDLAALRFATQSTSQTLINTLVKAGKYNWQAFGSHDTSSPAPSGRRELLGISPSTCTSFMTTFCNATFQNQPLLMKMTSTPADVNATVAAFLIVRPPHAYLGWSWESDDSKWDPIFLLQAGTPTSLCTTTAPGVFERQWTNGVARLDCNTWTGTLPFPSL